MKHLKTFTQLNESKSTSPKKVSSFDFEEKTYDIFQDSNDDSLFGTYDKKDGWGIVAMGDEFNPEAFDSMNLKKMISWIDAGIKHFSEMKNVSINAIKKTDWSDVFQSEIHDTEPEMQKKIDKLYVITKLQAGKKNAEWNSKSK